MTGDPYPKSAQLARGPKRYRRKVASAKRWAAIRDAKLGPCRVCGNPDYPGWRAIELHHVVARVDFGDDLADNLVPVCSDCHDRITRRDPGSCRALVLSLDDAEYAYCIQRGGESYLERRYGIEYQR